MVLFGFLAVQAYHYLALFVPVLAWWVTRPFARKRAITIIHTSSLAVSYWEEILFRGFIYGGCLLIWHNTVVAVVATSLIFGIFHLRNLWWSSRRQVLFSCLYAALWFGPVAGVLRWWSGDIYLGIALHAVNNFTSIALSANAPKPTDRFLLARQGSMNWFQWLFSGFWLIPKGRSGNS